MVDSPWRELIRAALAEDRVREDVTTGLLGVSGTRAALLRFVAETRVVVAGIPVVADVFAELDPSITVAAVIDEGEWALPAATLAEVRGPAAALLAGERVVLNFLQHITGVATATRRIVDLVSGTGAQVTHTRKTMPGLRAIELYGVRIGGGVPNRASLADAVMWKDNHWALLSAPTGLSDALAGVPSGLPVIVEVETENQLETALAAGVTHVLVDNQPPSRVAAWVRQAGPAITIQVSGGITADNARAYAEAGATLLAVGAITHSAPAASIRCDLV